MVPGSGVAYTATTFVKISRSFHEIFYPSAAETAKFMVVAKLGWVVFKMPGGVMVNSSRRENAISLQHKQGFSDATEIVYVELLRISVNKHEHKEILHILGMDKYSTMLHRVILTKTVIYVYIMWPEYQLFCFCLRGMGKSSSYEWVVTELQPRVPSSMACSYNPWCSGWKEVIVGVVEIKKMFMVVNGEESRITPLREEMFKGVNYSCTHLEVTVLKLTVMVTQIYSLIEGNGVNCNDMLGTSLVQKRVGPTEYVHNITSAFSVMERIRSIFLSSSIWFSGEMESDSWVSHKNISQLWRVDFRSLQGFSADNVISTPDSVRCDITRAIMHRFEEVRIILVTTLHGFLINLLHIRGYILLRRFLHECIPH
ncbi:uncharacterized protein LOC113310831 isoform X1 [Papaver somniferum]|uniref:uncharacterized protein LOC113310831 isoform X1 n=1 Tax=Papaver somniferum TaxID=3469 RepID=UPI000E705317|nr:uncharacterized protein LOC113310831 isoform X1 [Papaver somniferum]